MVRSWHGRDLVVEETNLHWLKKCMTTKVKDPTQFMDIQEAFLTEGFTTISIKYLGENLVLLANEYEDNLKDIFEGEDEWLSTIFESYEPWSLKL